MKKLTLCSRCHSMFDFDLYFGLCPKCGQFHRQKNQMVNDQKITIHPVEEHDHQGKPCKTSTSQKTTYSGPKVTTAGPKVSTEVHDIPTTRVDLKQHGKGVDVDAFGKYGDVINSPMAETGKHRRQRGADDGLNAIAKIIRFISIAVVFLIFAGNIIASKLPDVIDAIEEQAENILDTSVKTENQYEEIAAGDYMYVIYNGYVLGDPETTQGFVDSYKIPMGKKLIAIDMNIVYSGDTDIDASEKIMPVVYDGDDYCNVLGESAASYLKSYYDIPDTLGVSDVYSDDKERNGYGYLFYQVHEDAEYVTVCMDDRTNGETSCVHQVTVSLEDIR